MSYGKLGQKYATGNRSDPYSSGGGLNGPPVSRGGGLSGPPVGVGRGFSGGGGLRGASEAFSGGGGLRGASEEVCEFFAKAGWCKFGNTCRFAHIEGASSRRDSIGSSTRGSAQEACEFFTRAGWCKYGDDCRYQHIAGPDTPVGGPPPVSGEVCQFFSKAGWCKYGDQCKHEHIVDADTPLPPIDLGETCQFFTKAGWCQYGDGCRYQHIAGPDTPVKGKGSGKAGGTEVCEFFAKAGWCKYDKACRYAHIAGAGSGKGTAPPLGAPPWRASAAATPPRELSESEYEEAAAALLETSGMQKAESVGVQLTDEAVQALLTLPASHASELLDALADKHSTLRDPSNYVIATIAKGYVARGL